MDPRGTRARQIQHDIRRILLNDWDPLDVRDVAGAEDEYDSYIGGVYRLLAEGATEEQIAEHLSRWQGEAGLSSTAAERLMPVARKLCALNVKL